MGSKDIIFFKDKEMKQKIQITDKNIGDIFRLPCVLEINKFYRVEKSTGDIVPSKDPKDIRVTICPYPNVSMIVRKAFYGDWIVEEDDGTWRVEKGEKHEH